MAMRIQDLKAMGINADASVESAFEAMRTKMPRTCEEYATHCEKYGWPERGMQEAPTGQWAYWFARHMITDRWEPAESLIETAAEQFREGYRQFVKIMTDSLMVGHSVGRHKLQEIKVTAADEAPPEPRRDKFFHRSSPYVRKAAAASGIADEVEKFKRDRKKANREDDYD